MPDCRQQPMQRAATTTAYLYRSKSAFPDAKLPVVTLSLAASLDPALHIAAGRALAPLRDQGVLIVGSGMSFHNLRGYMRPETPERARGLRYVANAGRRIACCRACIAADSLAAGALCGLRASTRGAPDPTHGGGRCRRRRVGGKRVFNDEADGRGHQRVSLRLSSPITGPVNSCWLLQGLLQLLLKREAEVTVNHLGSGAQGHAQLRPRSALAHRGARPRSLQRARACRSGLGLRRKRTQRRKNRRRQRLWNQ